MARPEKVAQVEKLRSLIEDSEAAILVDYTGLNVTDMGVLRRAIRDSGARLQVVKNALFRRALEGTAAEGLIEHIVGPVGVTFCPEDVGPPAKAMVEFSRGRGVPKFTAAWADDRIYDAGQVVARSSMPGRTELLGMVANVLNAPITGLARSLCEIQTKLARAIGEVAKKQEQAA
jgi:large subunit ribosomal protein L10